MRLKELEIILSDFACNKHCPYCTAKSTLWPVVEDNMLALELAASELDRLGYSFKYLTIGGNGEPTLHSYEKLASIVDIFKDKDIQVRRVLTSGNIFLDKEKEKFDLLNDAGYVFEITMTSLDQLKDMITLGYDNAYLSSEQFKRAKRVRVNYVMLKENQDTFLSEVKGFLNLYPNVETVSIKLLNINTKTNDSATNGIGNWILEHSVPKSDRLKIKNILDNDIELSRKAEDSVDTFDTMSWSYNGKEIYFSYKSTSYGLFDLVWYGDKFVDYQLNPVQIADNLKRVYVAKKFDKICRDGEIDLSYDIRDIILKEYGNKGLLDYSPNCFIEMPDIGNGILHYVGPFYNEKAGLGILTSTECEKVVEQEKSLIDICDVFVCYLYEELSPGTISEIIYAATLHKEIIVYYESNSSVSYELKTDNWFPITLAKKLTSVKLIEI